MRYSQAGLAIAKFSIATNEKTKDGTKTEWHNIVAFGKLAEICGEYLHKGDRAAITGRIQTSNWTDRDDIKRYSTEIVAAQMEMLGSKQSNHQNNHPPQLQTNGTPVDTNDLPTVGGRKFMDDDTEDIPF